MRRVLFLASWYPSPDNPVLGTFVQEHAKAAALHHDVIVIYVYERRQQASTSASAVTDGLREIRSTFSLGRHRRLMAIAYTRAFHRALRHLPSGWAPDIIHVHVGYPAGLAAVAARIRWRHPPIIYTEQAGPLREKILASRTSRIVVPLVRRLSAVGAPVSSFLAADMANHRILPRRTEVLPNAVDTSTFHSDGRARYDGGTLRLLAAALLVPGKGLEHAIQALPQLVDAGLDPHLMIAGAGPLRRDLQAGAAARGLADRVTFLGLMDKTDLADQMRRAHIFLMPSERETFSAVLVEAMACGLPIVATRSGGPQEIVTPDAGILVQPGSAAAIADGVKMVAEGWAAFAGGPSRAQRMYSSAAVGLRMQQIYDSVAS